MTRPRDNQRQRLYDSDYAGTSDAARRLLTNGPKVRGTGSVSIEACQTYVDHVTGQRWFRSRWGKRTITVKHKVYGQATGYYHAMMLPPWARTEATILHELAHALTPSQYASHGPEFAGVLLTLVRNMAGADAGRSLREAYRTNRVRMNLKAVPDANTHTVVPQSTLAAAKRRDATRPLTPRETTSAAEVIRRAVKAGTFGASGTKTRTAALATARTLEKVAS